MYKKFTVFFKKLFLFKKQKKEINLLHSSQYFNKGWYLANNVDVAKSKIDPYIHYLEFGGFEGRDPGPDFSSSWYLHTYTDVNIAGVNPLVHYLKYGIREGRKIQPSKKKDVTPKFQCSVCKSQFNKFIPLSSFYLENKKKYGNIYKFEDTETLNVDQYQCPVCHASDRERLYALFLSRKLANLSQDKIIRLLDIAPSPPLRDFLINFSIIEYVSADKFMEGVDIEVDLMNMQVIQSESFDVFICSHVLEHVEDDIKALGELYRILKHGGFGILMVPINLKVKRIDEDPTVTDIGERWRRFGQDDHVRIYSKKGFVRRVKRSGFKINLYGVDFFSAEEFSKYGITSKSVLYVVEKL